MYWTDWGSRPGINRAWMDGNSVQVLVSTSIRWPNGLVLDRNSSTLYWCDGFEDRIESCNTDGTNRRAVISSGLVHTFGRWPPNCVFLSRVQVLTNPFAWPSICLFACMLALQLGCLSLICKSIHYFFFTRLLLASICIFQKSAYACFLCLFTLYLYICSSFSLRLSLA